MIVRNLAELIGTERDVAWGNGQSRRFLLERDRMGYSVTDTTILANTESWLEYKNHKEACYCIEGTGEIEADGIVYPLEPGSLYVLDKHEKHYLRAKTDMRLVCVFAPALRGNESHHLTGNDSSSY